MSAVNRKSLLLLLFLLATISPVIAGEWRKVNSDTLTVVMPKSADLSRIYRNLANRQVEGRRTLQAGFDEQEQISAVVNRVIDIFNAVNRLSGQNIQTNGKARIVFLNNHAELSALYHKRYNRNIGSGISFFDKKYNTVYTTLEVNARVLAHELTHLILDIATEGSLNEIEHEKSAYKMEVNF